MQKVLLAFRFIDTLSENHFTRFLFVLWEIQAQAVQSMETFLELKKTIDHDSHTSSEIVQTMHAYVKQNQHLRKQIKDLRTSILFRDVLGA